MVWCGTFLDVCAGLAKLEINFTRPELQSKSRKIWFLEMQLLECYLHEILQDYQYWCPKLILKISDRYLQDWLSYRTICEMPKKAGLYTARPIKCSTAHKMLNRSHDFIKLTGWCHSSFNSFLLTEIGNFIIKARPEQRFCEIFLKTCSVLYINFRLNCYYNKNILYCM